MFDCAGIYVPMYVLVVQIVYTEHVSAQYYNILLYVYLYFTLHIHTVCMHIRIMLC